MSDFARINNDVINLDQIIRVEIHDTAPGKESATVFLAGHLPDEHGKLTISASAVVALLTYLESKMPKPFADYVKAQATSRALKEGGRSFSPRT